MIKRLFKWFFRLILLLVILLVILVLSLDAIMRSVLEQRIRRETGMDARIGRLTVGLLSSKVTAENVKVFNSAAFGGTLFLDIPEVHIEYDRFALCRRKLHITLLRLHLAEANVVKNAQGSTNVLSTVATTRAKTRQSARWDFAGIDVLNLSLGTVRFVDLKNQKLNRERVFGIKNRVYPPMKTTGDLQGLLLLLWIQSGGGGFSTVSPPTHPSSPSAWWSPSDTIRGSNRTSRGTPS